MKYSQEERNEVKDCFQEHLSVSSIVQTFKIPYQTVYKFISFGTEMDYTI